MKLLIICFGGPAELLLTTPILRCLRQQLNNTEIHYLLLSTHKTVLDTNPYIDHFHFIQNGMTGIVLLKDQNFDHVIDLQGDSASSKIVKALQRPVLKIKKYPIRQFLQKNLGLNLMPKHAHVARLYLETIETLGVRNDGAGLDYFIPKNEELKESDIPASHHYGFVAITLGAFRTTNQIPAAKLQELCKAIDHPIVLLGDNYEFAKAEAIASFDAIKIYNACGKFSFHETGDLIRKSKLVIAQDNDLLQLAVALKKPVIAVWGRTSPSTGRGPYYGSRSDLSEDVRVKNLKKFPVEQIVQLVNRRLALLQSKTEVKSQR